MSADVALALTVLATASGGIEELWKTPVDGGSLVRIEACGGAIRGRAVTSPRLRAFPGQTDVRNHNHALRGRALMGLLILKVRPLSPGRWGDGWVYDPEEGATYQGAITLRDDGRLELKGCVVAPFCKTQVWTRSD